MISKLEISSYLSAKTKVTKSSVEGQGLFAVNAIRRKEIVAIKGGTSLIEKLSKSLKLS